MKWLHRIGYVTTAIIALELIGISGLELHGWIKQHKRVAEDMARTRTHEGPLPLETDRLWRPDDNDRLAALPPLHGDGLRFVAMPSLIYTSLGYTLNAPSGPATPVEGVLRIFHDDPRAENPPPAQTIHFTLPAPTTKQLITDIGRMTDNWPGAREGCTDGTPMAFELKRAARVTSGRGNCDDYYWTLSMRALRPIQHLLPPDLAEWFSQR